MSRIIRNLPFNRVEGDLEVGIEVEDGVIVDAWSAGTLYRGFENLMKGRGALDGLVMTPRVCGICSTTHLYAAVRALDAIAGVVPPDNAVRVRNVALMVEHMQSDVRQSVLMFMADFANAAHAGHALHEEAVRRYLLWPHLPDEAARSNLRKTVFKLRDALGRDEFPRATPTTVFLDPADFSSDMAEFMAPLGSRPSIGEMERKAALYRGRFLDGIELDDCPNFSDWLALKREACTRHAIGLLDRLGDAHEQAGDFDKAIHVANVHLGLEPWHEAAHRRVMRALAGRGDIAGAVTQYERCKNIVRSEHGTAPETETRELLNRIRTGKVPRISVSSRSVLDRRQVTALCCGFTASQVQDPEEVADHWLATQQRIQDVIREHGGYVAQSHGGTVLGYFGYPVALEDAARRAVRTALELQRLAGAGLIVRCGIHTGMVVASDSLPDAMGLTSAAAVRLRDIADGVLVSGATQQLVEGYFELQPAGRFEHMAEQVPAYRVLGIGKARYRLEAADRLTPYVGRLAEIDILISQWRLTGEGGTRVVLVRGDAGIGKSRLVRVLREQLGLDDATCELRCVPELIRSPFHPMKDLIEGICGLVPGDAPERKSSALARHYESHFPGLARAAVPLLTSMLSLPVLDGYPLVELPAQQQKEQTIDALLGTLWTQAAARQSLLIFEDMHWADASTLELLARLVGSKSANRMLVVLTARPGFACPWPDNLLHAALELSPLNPRESAAMVASLTPAAQDSARGTIVERCGGIPLFIEEMTKLCHADLPLPSTLQDLLAAELDALGEAKRTAQLAATIGRQFDLDLLHAISDSTPMLDPLLRSGLIYKTRGGLKFKHALIREAAYHSQTKADRQTSHRRIAENLDSPDRDTAPEVLAQHWAACGEPRRAIEAWLQAGRRTTQQSGTTEAVAHFQAGLALIGSLAPGVERDRLEFYLQAALGVALQAAHGYGSELAKQANTRAAELSKVVSDSDELFRAKWAQVMHTIAGSGSSHALRPARELIEEADRLGDPLLKQAAHYAMADAAFWAGDFETTHRNSVRALGLYSPEHHPALLAQFGEDISVACMAYQAWSEFFLGHPDTAKGVAHRMLDRARKLEHPHTLALALCFSSVLHRWLEKPIETLALARETIAVSSQHGFPVWLAAGEMTHGWALVKQGRTEQGLLELKSSIGRMREAIPGIAVVFLSALAEAYMHCGRHREALGVLSEALAVAETTTDGHFTAEVLRLRGECIAAGNGMAEAKADFLKAQALSRQQGALSLELKAAISLAAHFGDRASLASAYEAFGEGHKTPHLVQAANQLRGKVT